MNNLVEQQTEWIINNILVNKGWIVDNNANKNVFFQSPPFEEQKAKLNGKRPDYILYQTGTKTPIAIIEAKKGGENLDKALDQATEYANLLGCKVVFAINNTYCITKFVPNGKELILNRNEVTKLLTEHEILTFIEKNSNDVCTIPEEILIGRDKLISVFKNLNDVLRSEGLRAGMERFSEFANILFLKLISENGRKPWWNNIKKQSNEDLLGYINKIVIDEVQKEYGGEVFLPLQIANPINLRTVIDKLDPIALTNIDFDVKGEAFEHFLEQTTSTENDLGEYFTPRHIVKFIVNLVDPKFKETVYDPFCGTGGFLTESFKYIKDNTIIKTPEDEELLKEKTIYGREITLNARIAKMNMILQGDGHSGIEKTDSLAKPVEGLYDIVITNMPFSLPTTHSNLYENSLAKNNGDSVCVLHCFKSLKVGGRMALVVPEGFLFRKDSAKVREFLLKHSKLQAVISLPQGAFLPYTAVKTDVLYFINAHLPNNQKEYWYFDTKNIGFTLDNKRKKINGESDLRKIEKSELMKVDKKPELRENLLALGFEPVLIEKIKKNYYNLIGTFYRETKRISSQKIISIAELCNNNYIVIEKGKTITKEKTLKGNIPVIAAGKTSPYCHNKSNYNNNIITISASGAHAGYVWYHNYPIWASDCNVIYSINENIILTQYLYYILSSMQNEIYQFQHGAGQPHVYSDDIKTLQIPLLSIQEQHDIVNNIQKIELSINDFEKNIENLKNNIGETISDLWK